MTQTQSTTDDEKGWPYPFERYGENDPLEKIEAYRASNPSEDRISAARTIDPSWDPMVIAEETTISEARVENVLAEMDDEASDETADASGADLFNSGQVISPDNNYDLSDNVASDVIDYVRSSTVRNEEQMLLLALAHTTSMFDDPSQYICSVTIGTSSSGKTHLKDKVDDLFAHFDVMDVTSGSDKSLVYDDDWDGSDYISRGELNQPSTEMIEFMKRSHGGDGEVNIRSTRGNPSSGFSTKTITKQPKSYHFTFAQFDADFEFWNRLLKIPVHESESKNKAVGRMAFGHNDIDLGDDVDYGYEFDEGRARLQSHMLDIKRHAPKRVFLPDSVKSEDWSAWDIVAPIFNHSRSESNRVYSMVSNLIRASTLLNYQDRETIEFEVRVEDGVETQEALIAEPQDVANVMRCLETLRSTTHEIDDRKRGIIDAIKARGNDNNTVEGVEPIVDYLEESDASAVNQSELEAILDDLAEDYLVTIDGGSITAKNWDELGEPKIDEHSELFEDCTDPIDDRPFLESWADLRADASTTASDLLETAEIESSTDGISSDMATESTAITEAVEDAALESWQTPIVATIQDALDGERVEKLQELPVESFIGLTSAIEPDQSVATSETMLDPNHSVWDRDDQPDEWIGSETDARRKIQQTVTEMVKTGLLTFEEVHERHNGQVASATLAIGGDE